MKKIFKYFLLVFLMLLFTSLLTEAILGIIFHFKDRDLEPMAVHDYPYLYYLFDKTEGLDEHGLKTNHPQKKQTGKYRIILSGGSVARGKAPEESIAHYLEKELNTRFSTDKIEVINAGVSAFVVEQEFILTQLVLRHYEPNMIVGIDGYNDLMTFKLNRQSPSEFELPPHNWQDFRVIQENREKKSSLSRFPLFFRNISRAIHFIERNQFEKNFDWNGIPDDKLQSVSSRYWQIIDDTHGFCEAKNIGYYSFLQPVRFYSQNKKGENQDEEKKALCKLYKMMDEDVRNERYAFSITSLLNDQPEIFTDDCHVTSAGNQLIAKEMAERIAGDVESWMDN